MLMKLNYYKNNDKFWVQLLFNKYYKSSIYNIFDLINQNNICGISKSKGAMNLKKYLFYLCKEKLGITNNKTNNSISKNKLKR